MKGYIIHEHGLIITFTKKSLFFYSSSLEKSVSFKKNDKINLEKDLIYEFYCSTCRKYSLNYDDHDNYNYSYMINPSDSNSRYIKKFQDYFNIGYILLGNEIERENYIYNYFNEKIERLKNEKKNLDNEKSSLNEQKEQLLKSQNLLEKENSRLSKENERLKNDNKNLTNEKSDLNEKKEQILKNQNLLEEEKSRLSQEIKTLNDNNDKNEKNFQEQINELNNEIEKKKKK